MRDAEASRVRLALALEAGNSVVWELDTATGRVLQNDGRLCRRLGYAGDDLASQAAWFAVCHEEDRTVVREAMDALVHGRKDTARIEVRVRSETGSWHWILAQGIAAERDSAGKALRLVGTYTDITELKVAEEQVRHATLHDPLTGVPNRRFVFEFGTHMLTAAGKTKQGCALLLIDLDRFQDINNVHGHQVGDQVLREAAERLQRIAGAADLVGRVAGDEFVMLLPDVDRLHLRPVSVAQQVLHAISQPFQIGTLSLSVAPSIGISHFPDDAQDMNFWFYTAGLAMNLAKRNGRGNYQFYRPELNTHAAEIYALETCMKRALKEGGFQLVYQPVVDIATGALISAEALLRLADAEGNPISPQRFIPIAEATGLISEIGRWVAVEACRQLRAWHEKGLPITVAVNVSPIEFRQAGFADQFLDIVMSHGVDPAHIQVEVTESAVMECIDDAVQILAKIKQQGVKVALDDFGTGYSSLSILSSLPLDKLKVDQSFVRKMETDAASRVITETIVSLGRSLDLEVIGEGIETPAMLAYLRALGCQQAQGYLISRPLSADDFAGWCSGHERTRSRLWSEQRQYLD